MSDERIPTESRMPSGRPLLDIRLQLVRERHEGYSAIRISLVPKTGTKPIDYAEDEDDNAFVVVPVARWEEFVTEGARLVDLGRRQLLHAPQDPAGGFVVRLTGERPEGAVAMLVDNRGYWVRPRPLAGVREIVSEDVPAPPGSVFMIHDGVPRIVIPQPRLVRDDGHLMPGVRFEQSDIPSGVVERGQMVAAVVDPRRACLATDDQP